MKIHVYEYYPLRFNRGKNGGSNKSNLQNQISVSGLSTKWDFCEYWNNICTWLKNMTVLKKKS